jgi:hypothetical protein
LPQFNSTRKSKLIFEDSIFVRSSKFHLVVIIMKKNMFSAPSRNMLRGNQVSKTGNFARSFQKPNHVRPYVTAANCKVFDARKKIADKKKDTQQQPKAKLSTEYRFTIPNVPG